MCDGCDVIGWGGVLMSCMDAVWNLYIRCDTVCVHPIRPIRIKYNTIQYNTIQYAYMYATCALTRPVASHHVTAPSSLSPRCPGR